MIYADGIGRTKRFLVCLALAGGACCMVAQPREPAFEVSSIKRSPDSFAQAVESGSLIGMRIDAGFVHIGHMALEDLIQSAYGVKGSQLVGPAWLGGAGGATLFNIEAKIPDGASIDQVPLMLRSLLADRFKLSVHQGSVEVDSYSLLVGDGGIKFRKAGDADPSVAGGSVSASENPRTGTLTINVGDERIVTVDGVRRIEMSTLKTLARFLSTEIRLPVIDKTGLEGSFDIKFELRPPVSVKQPVPVQELSPEERRAIVAAALSRSTGPKPTSDPVFSAVEQLGLRLMRGKNEIATIIVDSVEKFPTEN